MSRIVLLDPAQAARPLEFSAAPLTADAVADEKTIQRLVFENPGLIPIEEIDPGAGVVAPLCRELTLRGGAGPVYLDMLGVTRRGRLVLVECKLWRNPQARREVIGQILEYAALVGKLSYSDLCALVSQRTGVAGPNVLWTLAKDHLGLDDEAAFVDAVMSSLEATAFDLIILGDGIRGEIEVVRNYLETTGGLRSRLALVEVNCWKDQTGRTLFVPRIALRTKVIEHRVVAFGATGAPVAIDDGGVAGPPSETSEAGRAVRASNRVFWQAFIDQARFSHPDQPPPSHGSNNWVRIPLPLVNAVAYRAGSPGAPNSRVGFSLRLVGDEGRRLFEALQPQEAELARELGAEVRFAWAKGRDVGDLLIDPTGPVAAEDQAQLAWLLPQADRVVSVLRPRLAQLAEAGEDADH